jgi:hypothetical protein
VGGCGSEGVAFFRGFPLVGITVISSFSASAAPAAIASSMFITGNRKLQTQILNSQAATTLTLHSINASRLIVMHRNRLVGRRRDVKRLLGLGSKRIFRQQVVHCLIFLAGALCFKLLSVCFLNGCGVIFLAIRLQFMNKTSQRSILNINMRL